MMDMNTDKKRRSKGEKTQEVAVKFHFLTPKRINFLINRGGTVFDV